MPLEHTSEVGWNLSMVIGKTEWNTPLTFTLTIEGALFEG
jgi:hypothetical protein